jgi:acyl transferase domain-containing protein/acyl carrier protein
MDKISLKDTNDQKDVLKKAFLEIKRLKAELVDAEQRKREPIAIIGMSCRFPGKANDPESFWRLLRDGVDAVSKVPSDRWDVEAFYDARPAVQGKMNTQFGGFLEQVDLFDPYFFGISPREAIHMDPQQRLLLEVSWEALEYAGYAPDGLAESKTGVFIGMGSQEYSELSIGSDPDRLDAYSGTGGSFCTAAGRISYILGLQGPNFPVDTACSSSLVALHLACNSLRNKECSLALVGGVNLILSPNGLIYFSQLGVMAPDGHCKSFDASANGYVRAEGCAMVVLKRLSEALADGDNILALVRGSAINHNGHSNGLIAPSGAAQEAVIRAALENAGVAPEEIDYLEAHGTGTALGDPIEVQAINAALGTNRSLNHPLLIGSVKTNIGHTESAAGMAGLLKIVLSLMQKEIPPLLHLQTLNPYIEWEKIPVKVPTVLTPWQAVASRRYAGVSSFGMSGTNAHVILEEAPATALPGDTTLPQPPCLLTLSARSKAALDTLIERYTTYLGGDNLPPLADICFTSQVGRTHLPYRVAVMGTSREQIRERLESVNAGQLASGAWHSHGHPSHKLSGVQGLVFLFSGQGTQYAGMGRQLYACEPTFRALLQQCDRLLRPWMDLPLLEVLDMEGTGSTWLEQSTYSQPALFALEYALAQMWRSWGVEPTVLLGHSMGEYVAACIAGVYSLEDGLRLIATRGRVMQQTEPGAMVTTFASEDVVRAILQEPGCDAEISAINGRGDITISGHEEAVAQVKLRLEQRGLRCRDLGVKNAFHSRLMEPILADFAAEAARLTYHEATMPMVSSVTGTWVPRGTILDADYWTRQVRAAVQFGPALEQVWADNYRRYLEVGPRAALIRMGQQSLGAQATEGSWLTSLRAGKDEWGQILESLGQFYVQGEDLHWNSMHESGRKRVVLPTYPFQRQRYWIDTLPVALPPRSKRSTSLAVVSHPLFDTWMRSSVRDEWIFDTVFTANQPSFFTDHRLYGVVIVPAVVYLEMMLAAKELLPTSSGWALEDIFLHQSLLLSDEQQQKVQLIITREGEQEMMIRLSSARLTNVSDEPQWTLHASARLRPMSEQHSTSAPSLAELLVHCTQAVSAERFYKTMTEVGFELGPEFHLLSDLWSKDAGVLGTIEAQNVAPEYHLYPPCFDACLQTIGAACMEQALSAATVEGERAAYIPLAVQRFSYFKRPQGRLRAYGRVRQPETSAGESFLGDLWIYDESGTCVTELAGIHFKRAPREALLRFLPSHTSEWLYQMDWVEQPLTVSALADTAQASEGAGTWVVLADNGGVGAALAARLQAMGEPCVLFHEPQRVDAHWPEQLWETVPQPWRGVIHLWSVDGPGISEEDTDAETLQIGLRRSCGSALTLIQALVQHRLAATPLWIVTRGAQSVSNTDGDPGLQVAQSCVWGLGRTIAIEHPTLWGGLLDLDPALNSVTDQQAMQIQQQLSYGADEDQVAWRANKRYVARLERVPHLPEQVQAPASLVKEDASYLVTGGLGALGRRVVQWLVQNGARYLLLVSRQGRTPATEEWLSQFSAQGVQVQVLAVDVAQASLLESSLLAALQRGFPAVRGIIHAAGTLDDGILINQSWERFERVMYPKVSGAWNLHRWSQGMNLDFCIYFSSMVGLLGAAGQSNYAAANAFLDCLARRRRSQGDVATSINWGPWSQGGMATRQEVQNQRSGKSYGIEAITPEQGLALLEEILLRDAENIAVLPVNWEEFLKGRDRLPGALCGLAKSKSSNQEGEQTARGQLRQRLEQAVPGQRTGLLLSYVSELVARVLDFDAAHAVDRGKSFWEQGVDSLLAVQICNDLSIVMDIQLPLTLMFDYPTLETLTAYLISTIAPTQVESAAHDAHTAADKDAESLAELARLSEAEAEELLLNKLALFDGGSVA